jgi:hypothetical protein
VRFFKLDLQKLWGTLSLALAAASLLLGIVFWRVRNEDVPGPPSETP